MKSIVTIASCFLLMSSSFTLVWAENLPGVRNPFASDRVYRSKGRHGKSDNQKILDEAEAEAASDLQKAMLRGMELEGEGRELDNKGRELDNKGRELEKKGREAEEHYQKMLRGFSGS